MDPETVAALVDRFRRFDPVVELAIGRRTAIAEALTETNTVLATDIADREVPEGVRFVRDDLTDPNRGRYATVAGFYALNLPEELHRPALNLAKEVEVPLAVTTLGTERPVVPISRQETLPGETLYWIRE